MQNDKSLSLFKCPSYGAPLEPEKSVSSMKCPYCGATIVIPESLRVPAASRNYTSLSDVTTLAKQGKLDEAARVYSKITGLSHDYAMMSVKSMAGIREEALASNSYGNINPPKASPTYQVPPTPQPVYSQPRVRVRSGSCLTNVIRLVIFISVLAAALPALGSAFQFKLPFDLPSILPFFSGENPIIPAPFAKEVMSFSPGSFQDPRAIGVDGSGNIVVCDFNGGEIKIFDPTGNLISEFTASENTNNVYITSIAVSQAGEIYIPNGRILKFNEDGESLAEIGEEDAYYNYVALGPNDTLYAMSDDAIVRFDGNSAVDLSIPSETLENLTGSPTGFGSIAVDQQGNIYFWGDFEPIILKFSPSGEYLSQFGGQDDNAGNLTPGKFVSPHQILFDGYGRMYVVDFFNIQVLDSNGVYINQIDKGYYGAAFDSQNDLYATNTLSHDVVKFEIQKPNDP